MAEACVVCGSEGPGEIFAGRMLLAIRVPLTPSILPPEIIEGVKVFAGIGEVQIDPTAEVSEPVFDEVAGATYRVCLECRARPEHEGWRREEWLRFLRELRENGDA